MSFTSFLTRENNEILHQEKYTEDRRTILHVDQHAYREGMSTEISLSH